MSKYCIWLTLDSPELQDIIIELAERFNSPVFQAHCTIIGRTDIPIIKLKSAIVQKDYNLKLDSVHINSISYSENIWKSYYLELKEKHNLIELHEQFCNILSIEKDYEIQPHISLMYNLISEKVKQSISIPIKIGAFFKIHSIQITECGEEVERWKPIFELKV